MKQRSPAVQAKVTAWLNRAFFLFPLWGYCATVVYRGYWYVPSVRELLAACFLGFWIMVAVFMFAIELGLVKPDLQIED